MDDCNVIHLPVVEEEKYIGLVSEDDLLNAEDDDHLVETLVSTISKVKVTPAVHFTDSVQLANEYGLSVVPVVETDGQWVGAVAASDLLKYTGHMIGADEPGGIIVL